MDNGLGGRASMGETVYSSDNDNSAVMSEKVKYLIREKKNRLISILHYNNMEMICARKKRIENLLPFN